MLVREHVAFDLCFCPVTGEGRWAGELAGRCGGDDSWDGWRCNGDVFPFNVFVFWFGFMFDLDIFVEVGETAAEGARKGGGVFLEEWAYTLVVEGVGTGCDEEGLADGDRKETWGGMRGVLFCRRRRDAHMQQSGMLDLGRRLPLDGSLGSAGLAGSVVTARALSWVMAWVLEKRIKMTRGGRGQDTDLKALAAACHSLPTSIFILTDL